MGRPKEPLIDRHEVIHAALRLIDADGLGAFSLRRLGDAIGVNAASFYYHFESKEAILIEVAKYILRANRPIVGNGDSWQELVVLHAHQYRDALAEHPNIVPFMELHPHRAFAPDYWDATARVLLDARFKPSQVMPLLNALESLVLGHVRDLCIETTPFPDLTQYPSLRTAVEADTRDPREGLDLALRALVGGWPGASTLKQPRPPAVPKPGARKSPRTPTASSSRGSLK